MEITITKIEPMTETLYADDIQHVTVLKSVSILAVVTTKQTTAEININVNNRDILTIEGTNGQVPDYELSLRRALGELLEGLQC